MAKKDLSAAEEVAVVGGDLEVCGDSVKLSSGPYASKLEVKTYTESKTLSGASTSFTNAIPDGATVLGVNIDITTAITGASGYTVGDGSDADKWGDKTGTAVGTKTDSRDYTAGSPAHYASDTSVVLTAKTSNFTGGVARLVLTYLESRSAAG